MSLEKALPRALRLARADATLLRVLPLVLARNSTGLDSAELKKAAQLSAQEAALGFLLELTADLAGKPSLGRLATLFEHARNQEPTYFFEPRGERDRKLMQLRTPEVARRWGFFLNMPKDDFSSLLKKHLAPVQH